MESRPGVTIQQGVQILSVGVVVIQWPPVSGVAIQHEKSVESRAQPVESRPHGSKFNGVKIQSYTGTYMVVLLLETDVFLAPLTRAGTIKTVYVYPLTVYHIFLNDIEFPNILLVADQSEYTANGI